MRKSLLTFLLMLVGMTAWAQWNNPYNWRLDYADEFEGIEYCYNGSTGFYVQFKANGKAITGESIRVAAFIDGSCRAFFDGYEGNITCTPNGNDNGVIYGFRVWGNTSANATTNEGSELNKDVVFGIYYNNLLFKVDASTLGQALKFDGEAHGTPSNPIVINLDVPTGVTAPAIDEAVRFPYSKDMTGTWSLTYTLEDGSEYTPMNQAELMTELIPTWDRGQMSDVISFEDQKLTVTGETEGEVFLKIMGTEYVEPTGAPHWFEIFTPVSVKFTQMEIPVTSITLTKQSIVVNKSPNLILGRELSKYITINPEDATNKNFTLSLAEGVPEGYFTGEGYSMVPSKGTGENYYEIIISSVSNPEVKASIWVKIYAPVEELQVTGDVVTMNKGENIYTALSQYVTVLPEDATDKSITLTPTDENAFVDDIAVLGSGTGSEWYEVWVNSNDNPNLDPQMLAVRVLAKPETITCEPETLTVYKGDVITKLLDGSINVGPADATDKEFSVRWEDETAFDGNGIAQGAGIFKGTAYCTNYPEVKTDFYVEVKVRPERIYLSNNTYSYKVPVGTDIFEMLREYVAFEPADATETDYEIFVSDEASDAIVDGIARREGVYNAAITVASNYSDNMQFSVDIEIYIAATDIVAPEKIFMEVGQSLFDYLNEETVQINPEEANQEFKLTCPDGAFDGNYKAEAAGTYEVTVTTVAEPKLTKTVTVQVYEKMQFTYPSTIVASTKDETTFRLEYITEGLGIDVDKLEVYFSNSNNDWGYTPQIYMNDDMGLEWTIAASALAGEYTISVYYDNEEIQNDEAMYGCTVFVNAEVSFNPNGWDWIYVPGYFENINDLNIDENNKVIEIRSQTGMLYNDPEYGFFGDIYGLGSWDGMYKIKSSFADESLCNITAGPYWEESYKTLSRGYNWIGYTQEWDMNLNEFNELIHSEDNPNNFSEGDFILSKDGFIIYDSEQQMWISADNFIFEVGKGYIYYAAEQPQMECMRFWSHPHFLFPEAAHAKARIEKVQQESVWQYDASQFADNMGIVAELKEVDIPANYTIGAFVDGECRGKGKIVKGNIALINVAGKAGETVTFRLHNEITGEYSDIKESAAYSMMAGSLAAPLSLTADGNGTTDINGVADIDEDDIVAIYTLNGKKVTEMTEGIYIIQVRENGKIVTKKVKK